jgi:hypothetical protein
MKWQTILTAIALAVACLAAPAAAQDDKNPPKSSNARFGDPTSTGRMYQGFLYGVIKELNQSEMVLTQTAAGTDQTIRLKKKTKFLQDGKTSSLDKFKTGGKVWVDVDKGKRTGDLIAKKVVGGVDLVPTP